MKWYLNAFKKYATFSGRASRKEFWMFILFDFLIILSIVAIAVLLGTLPILSLAMLYRIATFLPFIAVWVRRMHDVNKSGWFLLLPIYRLILACTKGDEGENSYGPESTEDEALITEEVLDSHLTS